MHLRPAVPVTPGLAAGFALAVLLLAPSLGRAQSTDSRTQEYLAEPKGNFQFFKQGIMDGNLLRTLYRNQGEVGAYPYQPSGEWPRGSGHSYIDGNALMIANEFVVPGENGAPGDTIRSVATHYREYMDYGPRGEPWGLEPLPGYVRPGSVAPSISNLPSSWPDTWPRSVLPRTNPQSWDRLWYGYFGRGVINADLETYFVMDDATDAEFTPAPFSRFSRFYPVQADSTRLGMGLRVEVRGFQWSQVLAEDNIFWHYDVVNLSDRDYPRMSLGFLTDVGIGGTNDSGDDIVNFDTDLDIVYAYDGDNKGLPGNWSPVGYLGIAYLESPGIGKDAQGFGGNGIDDDNDGLVDESHDNDAGQQLTREQFIASISNYDRFTAFFGEVPTDKTVFWSGDENGNWIGYTDLNGNGHWDTGEPLNDDLGTDGVGPFDLQYTGADADSTEGNGRPDQGEPSFGRTDKDESDQIGLQNLDIYRLVEGGGGTGWPRHDEPMVKRMMSRNFILKGPGQANTQIVFGAGPFPLARGRRERFSFALIMGADLGDLTQNKQIVQDIYNANYNFTQPPRKPIVKATAGDGKVILSWDRGAESSYDRLLRRFDFEGYMVFRSEDPAFNDIKTITDGRGQPYFLRPIAQFDLKDGIKGFDPVGEPTGARFNLGNDTGIQNVYVDTTVVNGRKYYYAVAAYDRGDPTFGTTGLTPAITSVTIRESFNGTLQFADVNTAVVTPAAPAAGYVAPQIEGNLKAVASGGVGTGSIGVEVVSPSNVREGASYRVVFNATAATPTNPTYRTSSYRIVRTTAGVDSTVLDNLPLAAVGRTVISPPFDGLVVTVQNDTTVGVDINRSGWLVRNSAASVVPSDPAGSFRALGIRFPADYEITFFDGIVDTSLKLGTVFRATPVNFKIHNLTGNYDTDFILKDFDGSKTLTGLDTLVIVEYAGAAHTLGNVRFASLLAVTSPGGVEPAPGDRYRLATTRPFGQGDQFSFTVKQGRVDAGLAEQGLDRVAVVPNPYLGRSGFERPTLNSSDRGERVIRFIHLPQSCTIRIYTIAGALVRTVKHEAGMTDGSERWDLLSDDGTDVAYGIYIFHIDAPGVGERVGKFAIIK